MVGTEQPNTHFYWLWSWLGCYPHSRQDFSPLEMSFGNGVRIRPSLWSLSQMGLKCLSSLIQNSDDLSREGKGRQLAFSSRFDFIVVTGPDPAVSGKTV